MNTPTTEYFHFISDHRGDRYFKVNWQKSTCIQVVLDTGGRKGKSNCKGIYSLALASFRGTYHWHFGRKQVSHTRMLLTTENQFNIAFEKCIENLKTKP